VPTSGQPSIVDKTAGPDDVGIIQPDLLAVVGHESAVRPLIEHLADALALAKPFALVTEELVLDLGVVVRRRAFSREVVIGRLVLQQFFRQIDQDKENWQDR
jgi:hypothetical protein